MAKKVKVGDITITLPSLPEKPTKTGFFKMIMDGIKKNKDELAKYKSDKADYDKKISDVAEKLKDNPDLVSKIGGGTKKSSGIGTKVGLGVGAGGTLAGGKFVSDVKDEMQNLNKGGIVAPKMGGKPSFKTKKSSKSIAKKYFKGTFQLVELTKAVKHILRKIDSEIESRKNAFADGKIIKDNFEKSVGQVRGLVLAKEIVRETAKNIEELDD